MSAEEPDFHSVEQNGLDRSFILNGHCRDPRVYSWTVNSSEGMQRLFDINIGGVISHPSALARKTLDKYLSCPKSEHALRRLRFWLVE